jgi:hypothetical protein
MTEFFDLAFFVSSLALLYFHSLVFHLKQKHEEGQRLLHYLQKKNNL